MVHNKHALLSLRTKLSEEFIDLPKSRLYVSVERPRVTVPVLIDVYNSPPTNVLWCFCFNKHNNYNQLNRIYDMHVPTC